MSMQSVVSITGLKSDCIFFLLIACAVRLILIHFNRNKQIYICICVYIVSNDVVSPI